jgi:exonuclease III
MNIVSFNVNGISKESKRKIIFNKIKDLKCIAFLQETHSTHLNENKWKNDWEGKIFYSHGTSNSTGVCILIPPDIDCHIEDKITDDNGRIIIIKLKFNNDIYILSNVYAPTRDHKAQQLKFITELQQMITPYQNENLLIGGDFNLYLNLKLDKLDSMSNKGDNPVYRAEIKSMLETLDLNDAWRTLNPLSRRYTWHSRGRSSRLDYFFVSDHLLNTITDYKILPGLHSDHSILKITLQSDFTTRGRGYWKFNSILLHDPEYVSNIKKLIEESKKEQNNIEDKGLAWEVVKLKIRSFSVPYCINKKKKRNKYRKNLEIELENLQNELDKNSSELTLENFKTIKNELEKMDKEHINSIIFRSKTRWIEDGEKNTKYFLNLEKKNYLNKLISSLEIDGKITSNSTAITEEQTRFYKNLYTEKLNTKSTSYTDAESILFNNQSGTKLTELQKEFCDNDINESEILKSLKALKNGKTPGTDGLPPDFYKFFWKDIKPYVTDSIQYALKNNKLSIEQKRGLINLIPKKNKNRLILKNWRPISLLNTDYKLLAKILASRLQEVLPHIIKQDQTGYLKNRFIGQNIRLLEDITFFTKNEKLPGIIFSIDFEKAFDSVNWDFLFKTLKMFNFGDKFISFIKTMYCNIESTVLNNGKSSQFFRLERGVRQGCPLSAYLFIITIEILATHIRNNPNIKGIKIGTEEIKISLLADDITLLLHDISSLTTVIQTLSLFKDCAGLKINLDKSNAKYIGSLTTCDHYPHGLSWIKTPIKTLGISIVDDQNQNYLLNFHNRICTLKSTLNIWSQRNLSLKGKITVINNLALAPLIYASSVTNTPKKAISEINNIIQNFIWKGKQAKIAQKTLIQNIDNGGLKLCHFETKVSSLMLSWVKRLTTSFPQKWTLLPKKFYSCPNLKTYFNSNHKLLHDKNIPIFYKNIHEIYMKYFKLEPINFTEILNESLWLNQRIKTTQGHIYIKSWESNNILTVRNLFNEFGILLSHNELTSKYNIHTTFLQTLQVQKSIPSNWIKKINTHSNTLPPINTELCIRVNNILKPLTLATCKDFYWHILNNIAHIPTCIKKWNKTYQTLSTSINIEWKKIFNHSFYISRDTKIQTLQYKIIHRYIACNYWLKNIKILDSDICLLCNTNSDTIAHFFLTCDNVNHFWVAFNNWWNRLTDENLIDLAETGKLQQNILFGFPGHTDMIFALNYCVIYAKYYIYQKKIIKLNDLFILDYLIFLKSTLKTEKTILKRQNKLHKFEKFLFIYSNI